MGSITFSILAASLVGIVLFLRPRRRLPLPPGPPSIPLLGNIHHFPSKGNKAAVVWDFGLKYGPLVLFRVLHKHVLVINSWEACIALLNSRGARFDDRPQSVMIELMGWNFGTGLIPYGQQWRMRRAALQQWFGPAACVEHQVTQRAAIVICMQTLLDEPHKFNVNIRRFAAGVILSISHGFSISGNNDEFIKLADDAIKTLEDAGTPGSFAVDWLPILKYVPAWFPGASFKKFANQSNELMRVVIDSPFDRWKQETALGNSRQSMIADLTERWSNIPGAIDMVKGVTTDTYIAGADAVTATLQAFIFVMVQSPEVQRKAQDELDRVVGTKRLPDFADKPSLPYLEAVIRESARLYPVAPLGLAHATVDEEEYQGLRIPARTAVLPNVWGIFRDPAVYPQPEQFIPERHLTSEGMLDAHAPNPYDLSFGFGRRSCPGRHLASNSVWLAAATILSCFTLQPPTDANGDIVPLKEEVEWKLISQMKEFKCNISPRSRVHTTLIHETVEEARTR